jgi:BirA family biotin operon repressor/biotin-[acetyl-CoA-carboxylase] ligase
MSANDLSPVSITRNLNTSFIGQRVIYYPLVTSTMDAAKQEAQQGAAEGTVVMAGEQTAGRGRMKRSWLSPEGNIALSIILYPDVSSLPYLVMITSLAVVHSIEAVTGLKTQIKWPNDILISGKKVCGILIENELMGSRVAYAIIGIGMNIKPGLADVADMATEATSLNEESGGTVSRVEVIRHLLAEMERLYLNLSDRESVHNEWRHRLVTLGKRVQVESGGEKLEGIAESVDKSGTLLLRHYDGSLTRIVAGDVTLRHK